MKRKKTLIISVAIGAVAIAATLAYPRIKDYQREVYFEKFPFDSFSRAEKLIPGYDLEYITNERLMDPETLDMLEEIKESGDSAIINHTSPYDGEEHTYLVVLKNSERIDPELAENFNVPPVSTFYFFMEK